MILVWGPCLQVAVTVGAKGNLTTGVFGPCLTFDASQDIVQSHQPFLLHLQLLSWKTASILHPHSEPAAIKEPSEVQLGHPWGAPLSSSQGDDLLVTSPLKEHIFF